jgi:hypothetical protein
MYEVAVDDADLDRIAEILNIPQHRWPDLKRGTPREIRLISKHHVKK